MRYLTIGSAQGGAGIVPALPGRCLTINSMVQWRLPGCAPQEREQTRKDLSGSRRAAGDVEIDGDHGRDTPADGVAAGKTAAVAGAIADGNHPFRIGRGGVGARQRLGHVPGHRAGHQKHVGMARRGDEMSPKRSRS